MVGCLQCGVVDREAQENNQRDILNWCELKEDVCIVVDYNSET